METVVDQIMSNMYANGYAVPILPGFEIGEHRSIPYLLLHEALKVTDERYIIPLMQALDFGDMIWFMSLRAKEKGVQQLFFKSLVQLYPSAQTLTHALDNTQLWETQSPLNNFQFFSEIKKLHPHMAKSALITHQVTILARDPLVWFPLYVEDEIHIDQQVLMRLLAQHERPKLPAYLIDDLMGYGIANNNLPVLVEVAQSCSEAQLSSEDRDRITAQMVDVLSQQIGPYLSMEKNSLRAEDYTKGIQLFNTYNVSLPPDVAQHIIASKNLENIQVLLARRKDTYSVINNNLSEIIKSQEVLRMVIAYLREYFPEKLRETVAAIFEAIKRSFNLIAGNPAILSDLIAFVESSLVPAEELPGYFLVPLLQAAERNLIELVKLLAIPQFLNLLRHHEVTSIFQAAARHPEILACLIERFNQAPHPNVCDGVTHALFEAIRQNSTESINTLLERYRDFVRPAARESEGNLLEILDPVHQKDHFHQILQCNIPLGRTIFKQYRRYSGDQLQALINLLCHQNGVSDIIDIPDLLKKIQLDFKQEPFTGRDALPAIALYLACYPTETVSLALPGATYAISPLTAALLQDRHAACRTLHETVRYQPADLALKVVLLEDSGVLATQFIEDYSEDMKSAPDAIRLEYLLRTIHTSYQRNNDALFKQLVTFDWGAITESPHMSKCLLQKAHLFEINTNFNALRRLKDTNNLEMLTPLEWSKFFDTQPALEQSLVKAYIEQNLTLPEKEYWRQQLQANQRPMLQDILDHARGMHKKTSCSFFPYYSGKAISEFLHLTPQTLETKSNAENKGVLVQYMINTMNLANMPTVSINPGASARPTPTLQDLKNKMTACGINIQWNDKQTVWTAKGRRTTSLEEYLLDMCKTDPYKYQMICSIESKDSKALINKLKSSLNHNRSRYFEREKTTGLKVLEALEASHGLTMSR